VPLKVMAEFAAVFAGWFFGIQSFALFFMTPGFTAGVIAEEKERKTLDFLLVTDLRSREIVFGKLAARVAYLFTFVLVGLPILALLPLLGGIEPALVVAVAVATAVTMASLIGLAAMCSVHAPTVKGASGSTMTLAMLYGMVSGAGWLVLLDPAVAYFPSPTSPVKVIDLVEWINAGNPVSALYKVGEAINSGSSLDDVLPDLLRRYVAFHGVVAFVTLSIAVVSLRVVGRLAGERAKGDERGPDAAVRPGPDAAPAAATPAATAAPRSSTLFRKPPVSDRPVLWREVYCEAFWPRSRTQVAVLGAFAVMGLVPIFLMLWYTFVEPEREAARITNVLLRGLGSIVALMIGGAAATHAVRCVSKEREKRTLDELTLTSLDAVEVLRQKWLGAIASIRWPAAWLVLVWITAAAIDAAAPLAVVALVAAFAVYVVLGVNLGLLASVRSATMAEANQRFFKYVGLMVLALVVLGIVGNKVARSPTPFATAGADPLLTFLYATYVALVPPFAMGVLAFRDFEAQVVFRDSLVGGAMTLGVVVGLFVYVVTAVRLRRRAEQEFATLPHREASSPAR
jgi:ABC-type transport system involved in multi-copper enzyme maturation permease subunit